MRSGLGDQSIREQRENRFPSRFPRSAITFHTLSRLRHFPESHSLRNCSHASHEAADCSWGLLWDHCRDLEPVGVSAGKRSGSEDLVIGSSCSARGSNGLSRHQNTTNSFRDSLLTVAQVMLRRELVCSRPVVPSATPSRPAAATRSDPPCTACSAATPVPLRVTPTRMPTSRRVSSGRRTLWYVEALNATPLGRRSHLV